MYQNINDRFIYNNNYKKNYQNNKNNQYDYQFALQKALSDQSSRQYKNNFNQQNQLNKYNTQNLYQFQNYKNLNNPLCQLKNILNIDKLNKQYKPWKTLSKQIQAKRILDLYDIQDNYYTNNLDWGKNGILGVGTSNQCYLYTPNIVQRIYTQQQFNKTITCVKISQQLVVISFSNGNIFIFDINKNKKIRQIKYSQNLNYNQKRHTSRVDRSILLHDLRLKQSQINKLNYHKSQVISLKYQKDTGILASGGNDNNVVIWDIRINQLFNKKINPIKIYQQHRGSIKALDWCSWKRNLIASGGGNGDRTIRVWNIQKQKKQTQSVIKTSSQMPQQNTDNTEPAVDNGIIEEKITQANGQVKIKKYSKGKALGRGGFAKCYQVTNLENKKILAAKIIAKNSLNRSRAKQKICTNHTLNQLIKRRKRLTQMEVQYYLAQIVQSLTYLHQNKVIHRDLKLGNLFLSQNMQIKLGDFGLATKLQYSGQKKKTICGTPNYIAPQILQNKGHSYQVDVWSVGVIIYTLLIGKPPFETTQVKATYKKIKSCQYSFPDHVSISDNAKNLIQSILVLDPAKRPTLQQIMNDPFMTSQPIPKTMPRSTLACPPPPNFKEQLNNKPVQTKTQNISQSNRISRNDSTQRGFKNSNNNKQGFGSSQIGFRPSSRDKHSNKNLNPSSYGSTKKQKQDTQQKPQQFGHSQVHVKKWVDYSTKYGLGYLLSDGSTGVYFNDSTKIILDKQGQIFQYIQKKPGQKVDTVSRYPIKQFPQQRQLQKKVTLLQHFRNYLYADTNKIDLSPSSSNSNHNFCYVKKWMKTKHAIMFRLSNKIVQVNFTDRTQIILSSQQKLVTYINLKGQRSQYPLATALDSKNAQMAKRLKYTKQILTHMLNGTNVPQNNLGPDQNAMGSSSRAFNRN